MFHQHILFYTQIKAIIQSLSIIYQLGLNSVGGKGLTESAFLNGAVRRSDGEDHAEAVAEPEVDGGCLDDTEGANVACFHIFGEGCTCASIKSLCTGSEHSTRVVSACPASCGLCDVDDYSQSEAEAEGEATSPKCIFRFSGEFECYPTLTLNDNGWPGLLLTPGEFPSPNMHPTRGVF